MPLASARNCTLDVFYRNQPSLQSCPTGPLSIDHIVDRSLQCRALCGTVSQCLSTPQTLCWLTRAAPVQPPKNKTSEMSKPLRKQCQCISDSSSLVYLTPPGLHIVNVICVMLQGDDLSKVHVLVEELQTKSGWKLHQYNSRLKTLLKTVCSRKCNSSHGCCLHMIYI